MKRNMLIVGGLVTLLVAHAAGVASANPLARPVAQGGAPSVVSYQGQVTVAGTPYNGTGYFKFAVVDNGGATTYWSNDGTASGEPGDAVSLPVTNGLFTVLLGDTSLANMTALPASAFAEPERYLRVWFSSDGSTFAELSPDRRIAAVPYALQAEEARTHYQNVIVVAKSGGDFTSIQAALDSIGDAAAGNRYLVWVAPGEYNEQVTMESYVDIEGAGELATRIISAGFSSPSGTVMGASDAELRNLTVQNTGGTYYAIAVYNNAASLRMTNVTATASGADTNYGVSNDHSSPAMTDVTATASGADTNYGVYNRWSSPAMTHVTATASGRYSNYGVYNFYSSPAMTDVTATASGGGTNYGVCNRYSSPAMTDVTATASGGEYNYGVDNWYSSPVMTNLTATASGATYANEGVYNEDSSPVIRQSTIRATGSNSYGIYCRPGSGTVHLDQSLVEGEYRSISSGSTCTVYVGASQLIGPISGETFKCTGAYNGTYDPLSSSCQ